MTLYELTPTWNKSMIQKYQSSKKGPTISITPPSGVEQSASPLSLSSASFDVSSSTTSLPSLISASSASSSVSRLPKSSTSSSLSTTSSSSVSSSPKSVRIAPKQQIHSYSPSSILRPLYHITDDGILTCRLTSVPALASNTGTHYIGASPHSNLIQLVGVHVPMGGEQIVGRVVTRVVAPEGKSLKVSVMWSLDVGNVDGEGITVDAKEVTTDGGAQRKGRMADFDEDDETEDEGLSSRRKWTARFSVRKSEITTRCFEFAIPFGGEGSVLAAMRNLTRWSGIGDDEDDSIDVQLRMQVFCVVGERVLQDDSAVEGHVIDAEISLRQEEH